MPRQAVTLSGRCHCGNLRLTFESPAPPQALPVRSCSCSFCTRHRARTTRHPGGRVEVTIADHRQLSRYRFGMKTADFLVCRRCGVYVAAVLTVDDRSYATVNVNCLNDATRLTQEPMVADYEDESANERIARRVAGWTPASVRQGAVGSRR